MGDPCDNGTPLSNYQEPTTDDMDESQKQFVKQRKTGMKVSAWIGLAERFVQVFRNILQKNTNKLFGQLI